jgi:hypothetical protein
MHLTCEINSNLLENRNLAAYVDNSAEFTDNSAAFTDNSATQIPDALNKKSTEFLRKPAIEKHTQYIPIVHNTITHNTFQLHTLHSNCPQYIIVM